MSRVSPAEGPPPLQKPVASSSAVAPEDRPPLRKLAEFSKASSFGGKETEGFQFPAQFLRHCQTDVQEYYADCDNSVESMSTAAEEAAVAVAKPSMPTSNKRRVRWSDDCGHTLTQVLMITV